MVPRVRALARRLVWEQEVEDLVAEVLLTVWRRWDDLPQDADAQTSWILSTTRNTAWHVRRQSARSERLLTRLRGLDRPLVAEPDRTIVDQEAAEQLLGLLSAPDADLLRRSVVEGVPAVELATELNISQAALRTRLSRARRRLLHAYTDGEGE